MDESKIPVPSPTFKEEMDKANVEMLAEFEKMYNAMPADQRVGVIALASLIDRFRMQAGYKSFCRALVRKLRDGELKLE